MSAATRLPVVAGTLAIAGAVVALWKHPAVQSFIEKYLGTSASSTMLKALIGAAALLNLKNLPGFWHVSE